MKFRRWSQRILAAAAGTGLGLGLISCGASNTIDYLYLASAKNVPGQINVYRVDSQSGALMQIPNSPYPAGNNPVGLVTSPNGKNLYVINHDDNTIIDYGIGTDAKLYAQHTYNTPGSEPVALSINQAGTQLFVVDYFAPGFTALNPGPGSITVYPVAGDGSLGTVATQTLPTLQSANYYPLGNAPSGINVTADGSTVYVTNQLEAATAGCATGQGAVVALSVSSAGVLAPVTGSPFCTGMTTTSVPSAVASQTLGTANYVYVTDSSQNLLLEYTVQAGGALQLGASVATGLAPSSIVIHPNGLYMYVTNRGSTNLTGYSIAQAAAANAGVPTQTGTYTTGALPQCVIVEPHLKSFLYTADYNGFGSTGYKLDLSTGLLNGTQNSPYGGTGLSTCLAATSHGSQS